MGSSRITETNVIASPAPTKNLPTSPAPTESAIARSNWPTSINAAPPVIIARGPQRSTSTPTGICNPA